MENTESMDTRKIVSSLAVVVIVSALAYMVWGTVMKTRAPQQDEVEGVVCTQDAMQCPDGSWVGRSGPNCQFVCPIPVATSTEQGSVLIETALNKKVIAIQEGITPLEIVEDSRCPQGVQCIQAGTVRLRVRIDSGMGTSNQIMTLNQSVTTESETITLIAVRPEKEAEKEIKAGDYTFIFKVSKR